MLSGSNYVESIFFIIFLLTICFQQLNSTSTSVSLKWSKVLGRKWLRIVWVILNSKTRLWFLHHQVLKIVSGSLTKDVYINSIPVKLA